jgi:hypothetical protein
VMDGWRRPRSIGKAAVTCVRGVTRRSAWAKGGWERGEKEDARWRLWKGRGGINGEYAGQRRPPRVQDLLPPGARKEDARRVLSKSNESALLRWCPRRR